MGMEKEGRDGLGIRLLMFMISWMWIDENEREGRNFMKFSEFVELKGWVLMWWKIVYEENKNWFLGIENIIY